MNHTEIKHLLNTLSITEKAALCSGLGAWQTKAIPAKGIPSIWLADGPHGLRKEDFVRGIKSEGYNIKATCFPTQATLALSWDTELIANVGAAIGNECLANDVSVLLGPGINIKRSPLCGRNFEYYSEDPFLTGTLAIAMIKSVQKTGVGTSLKHFAANNQETHRMNISAEIDERALHEIYLKAFEMAVKAAHPRTVMCSYNRINGVYSSESKELLTDILRTKWGFKGLVMSDWGAVNSRVAGLSAGLDLEMPSCGGINDELIVNAIKSGALNETDLDKAVFNVLCLVFDSLDGKKSGYTFNQKAHHELCVKALTKSAVLLKNEGLLPINADEDIAVIGAFAQKPRYQGCGSSIINPYYVDSFLSVISPTVEYCSGYSLTDEGCNSALVAQALCLAKKHDKLIYFMGLTDIFESEGYDREHLQLPQNQIALLKQLAELNPNIIVVLAGGSPVEMPWLSHARALLYTALGGEGVGEGVRRILYGEVCPSGKLADTWPLSLADTPAAKHYPMGPCSVSYNESIFVGYRYYDTAGINVLFPFGYGLSYTFFNYSDIHLSHSLLHSGEILKVSFNLRNCGHIGAEEIAQLYICHKGSNAYQPLHTLAGFVKLYINPGEEKHAVISLEYTDFAFYNILVHDFTVEEGEYDILIGANSRELVLCASLRLEGEIIALPLAHSAMGAYGQPICNTFADKDFKGIYSGASIGNPLPLKGEYNGLTTLGLMRKSPMGRIIYRVCMLIAKKSLRYSTDKRVKQKVCNAAVSELPFKNISLNSMGLIGHEASKILLDICNGHGGYLKLVKAVLSKKHK